MEEKKIQFGFGIKPEHVDEYYFDSVEELLAAAQKEWEKKDGKTFNADGYYSGCIWVGVAESHKPADFAPSLGDIADQMTDMFYCEHNIDESGDVQVLKREDGEKEWKEFVNKYFELPCTVTCEWFGCYDLEEHRWTDKFPQFDKYVKQ